MESKKKLLFVSFSACKEKKKKDIFKRQNKSIYSWKLERKKNTIEDTSSIDVFPSTPPENGIQIFKKDLILKLNSKNLFDFEYFPKENDYLSIRLHQSNFLNLIHKDNSWIEEYYACFYRSPLDEYIELYQGKIDLSTYE